jgi:hypothetical protein
MKNKIFFKTSSNNYEVFISNEYQKTHWEWLLFRSEYEYANSTVDELDKK